MGLAGSSDLARARVLDGMGGRLALRTSLVVTTYNRPRALGVVLDSVLHQRLHPGDVVVADDGSGTDTTEVVAAFAARAPFRVRHCWQEDLGFRVAASRNRALAVAEGDYLVMVDGDLVLHGRFLEDHLEVARPGRFVQGSRVLLSKRTTVRVLSRRPVRLGPLGPGLRNRFNAVHSRTLCRLASRESADVFRVRSANLACWRADVLRVNGFDEDFVGWGREDSDFAARLQHAGLRRLQLKFAAIGYHLWHREEPRRFLPHNQAILEETLATRRVRCLNGIDKYL